VANSQTVDNVNLAIIMAMRIGLHLFFTARQPYWARSHSDTPQSVGLLWMSDRPFADTSTWQHTVLTRDRYPCLWRDLNPQSQEESGHRTTLYTARPPG